MVGATLALASTARADDDSVDPEAAGAEAPGLEAAAAEAPDLDATDADATEADATEADATDAEVAAVEAADAEVAAVGAATVEVAAIDVADVGAAAVDAARLEEAGAEAEDLDGGYSDLSLEELLNTEVISASSDGEKRSLASADVFVVTRNEIEQRGHRTIAQALATVPGIYVVDDLVTPAIAVRGINAGLRGGTRIVRVMIDGVQVNFRPDLTAFLGAEYIPMEAIDRIEIVKGPLSALYGANAFLATINIITRKPKPGLAASLTTQAGVVRQYDFYDGSGAVLYRSNDGGTSLLAAASMGHQDRSGLGLRLTFPRQSQNSLVSEATLSQRSRDDSSRPQSLFVAFEREGRAGKLQLKGGYQRLDKGSQFQNTSLFTDSRVVLENFWSNARWENQWTDELGTALSLGFATGQPGRDTELLLAGVTTEDYYEPNYDYRSLDLRAEATWKPSAALSLRVGVETEQDAESILYFSHHLRAPDGINSAGDRLAVGIDEDTDTDVSLTNYASYLQLQAVPGFLPDLKATGNVRLDLIKMGALDFPAMPSWRGALVYGFDDDLSARLVVGRAFQSPSAVLMFARSGFGNIGNIIGNAGVPRADVLEPQVVTSIELGGSARVGGVLAFELNGYYQTLENRIEFSRSGQNFRAENQATNANLGCEATVRLVSGRLSSRTSVSVQRTINEDDRVLDEPPASYPNLYGAMDVGVDAPELLLRADATLRWTGARGGTQGNILSNGDNYYSLDPYSMVDVVLSSHDLGWLGRDTSTVMKLGVRNLFDTYYEEVGYANFDVPLGGRSVFGEVQQSF